MKIILPNATIDPARVEQVQAEMRKLGLPEIEAIKVGGTSSRAAAPID
jgi:hypothetical protein